MRTVAPNGTQFGLGIDLVCELLPHRPPFLFVDTVAVFSSGDERPFLCTSHHISPNEPVYAGHFPDLYLWPGVYTLEGLAQTSLLLLQLIELDALWRETNEPGDIASALRAWQESRSRPGVPTDSRVRRVIDQLTRSAASGTQRRGGMLVGVETKFVRQVFAGQRLDYRVQRTHTVGQMNRLAVEASVGGALVAHGALTLALFRGAPVR
jgi:3-hydroxyacyl-[acyl-carrier-protein] dehydratase